MSDSLLDTLGDLLRPPVPYPDPVPFLLAELARCSCPAEDFPHLHEDGAVYFTGPRGEEA